MVSRKLLTLKNTTEESNMNNQLPRQGSAHVRFLVEAAVIAALYTVLTYLAVAMNLAYGPIQFRFSEALTILPVFTPAAIPGLALGCFLSNLASPLGIVDWVFGTLATLLAAMLSVSVFAGCGDTASEQSTADSSSETATEQTTEEQSAESAARRTGRRRPWAERAAFAVVRRTPRSSRA